MLKRKIYDSMLQWKSDVNHKPLIIRGLRQTGKTTIVKEFSWNNYKDVFFLDFRKDVSLHSLFDGDFNIDNLIFLYHLE